MQKDTRWEDIWWKTKEGDSVKIRDMDTNHIANTLAMLKRNQLKAVMTNKMNQNKEGYYKHFIKTFQRELDKRHEEFVNKVKQKSIDDIFPNNRIR